jgi:hypothetical protein
LFFFNLIEHHWDELKRQLRARPNRPISVPDLTKQVPAAMFQHLVENLPRRVEAVIAAKRYTILMPMILEFNVRQVGVHKDRKLLQMMLNALIQSVHVQHMWNCPLTALKLMSIFFKLFLKIYNEKRRQFSLLKNYPYEMVEKVAFTGSITFSFHFITVQRFDLFDRS